MNSPEEQFSELQRLLAIKRHERPPPGHFDRLAQQIRRALEAETVSACSTWWERFISRFDMQPAWAAALAVAVAAVYLYAFVASQGPQSPRVSVHHPASQDWVSAAHPFWVPSPVAGLIPGEESRARSAASLRSSVGPIMGMEPVHGFLTSPRNPDVLPASLSIRTP
ncbi:MAG: hypothetical protein QHJ82_03505 [Verrucomicrobiota bacterium]|nr:hypothetical protein [Verrucomicrobiota bacterium]